jgi:CheY-like chemotaxis protein
MRQGGQLAIELDNVTLTAADLAKHPNGQAGQFVRLRISDTGRGMRPAEREQLFEPFFSGLNWNKGRGLGLALVLAVAEQHHGWIECDSHVGRGTNFDLYLPSQAAETFGEDELPTTRRVQGAKTTVLLADGDPLVRGVGRRILEGQGYRVLLAEDGGQAIAIYREEKQRIDLAILDLNMPRLTVCVVLERLLEIDPDARVLFSGDYFVETEPIDEGHTFGVIAKPFSRDELVDAVRRALSVRNDH